MDINTELEFEIKALREQIKTLESKIEKYKQIIRDNDIETDLGDDILMSNEEFICVDQIRKLKHITDMGMLSKDEVQMLDILHKNLRLIRGLQIDNSKSKKKPKDIKQLLEIVNGKK